MKSIKYDKLLLATICISCVLLFFFFFFFWQVLWVKRHDEALSARITKLHPFVLRQTIELLIDVPYVILAVCSLWRAPILLYRACCEVHTHADIIFTNNTLIHE